MTTSISKSDVVLIGGGIMSATLGTLLKELKPDWNIKVFEKLDDVAIESSNAWNNAGTGHSALCELNYTPELEDGSIDTSKAIKINEQFQISKQLWAYLIEQGHIDNPEDFIRTVPHMSFVEGEKNVDFLKKRVEKLTESPLFEGMEYSDDHELLKEWLPLMMSGRQPDEKIGMSRIDSGTDINFGSLTKKLFNRLEEQGVEMNFKHAVQDLRRTQNDKWQVKVKNLNNNKLEFHTADFVFIGAGGGSLPLLQKTNIPESKNIGGFPVSGLFLVCDDEEIVNQHEAKVYGKAKVGAPPMSVPHLDTRYIDGKRSLLFGPFAGFSPKFLKTGSYMDLLGSVKPYNVLTMLSAGAKELGLTKYLVEQVLLKDEQRMEELREFIPEARSENWSTITAGQRVQMIKDTDKGKGTLMFGTETIVSEDGSMSALLGASPGASVCVDAMLELMKRAFPGEFDSWQDKIKEMIPSYGVALSNNREMFEGVNDRTSDVLKLKNNKADTLLS